MPIDTKKLRSQRESLGLTQSEVAEIAGMSQQAFARIETGVRNDPVFSTVESIADALDISIDELRDKSPKRSGKRK